MLSISLPNASSFRNAVGDVADSDICVVLRKNGRPMMVNCGDGNVCVCVICEMSDISLVIVIVIVTRIAIGIGIVNGACGPSENWKNDECASLFAKVIYFGREICVVS